MHACTTYTPTHTHLHRIRTSWALVMVGMVWTEWLELWLKPSLLGNRSFKEVVSSILFSQHTLRLLQGYWQLLSIVSYVYCLASSLACVTCLSLTWRGGRGWGTKKLRSKDWEWGLASRHVCRSYMSVLFFVANHFFWGRWWWWSWGWWWLGWWWWWVGITLTSTDAKLIWIDSTVLYR